MAEETALRLHLARFTVPRETSPLPQIPFSSRHVLRGVPRLGSAGLKRRRRSDDWR